MHVFLFLLLQLFVCVWSQTTIFTISEHSSTSSKLSTSLNSTATPTPTSSVQFPSLGGVSSCVSNCLALSSSSANCTSVVAVNCFCSSKQFTKEIVTCISSKCPSELSTAELLAQQFCNVASGSVTLSFPTAPTSSTSSSLSATLSLTTPITVPPLSTTDSSTLSLTFSAPLTTPTTNNALRKGFSINTMVGALTTFGIMLQT